MRVPREFESHRFRQIDKNPLIFQGVFIFSALPKPAAPAQPPHPLPGALITTPRPPPSTPHPRRNAAIHWRTHAPSRHGGCASPPANAALAPARAGPACVFPIAPATYSPKTYHGASAEHSATPALAAQAQGHQAQPAIEFPRQKSMICAQPARVATPPAPVSPMPHRLAQLATAPSTPTATSHAQPARAATTPANSA